MTHAALVLTLAVTAGPAAAADAGSARIDGVPAPVPTRPPAGLPAAAGPVTQGYVIGPDDVLQVHYWRDEDLSAEVVVRPDGRISLPLLRDVEALGLTPDALADRIQTLAATYLERPTVTVVVKQINSRKVFITGEVAKPGPYTLSGPTTVLQMIASAGGLTPFAKASKIIVMRASVNGPVTVRFDYKKVSSGQLLQSNVVLQPGDTVIVP